MDSGTERNTVRVTIYNQPYTLAVSGEPGEVEALAHQIDQLMMKQAAAFDRVERVQLFADAQRVFDSHLPAIYFGAPYVYVATSMRVLNARPTTQRPALLRNADELAATK